MPLPIPAEIHGRAALHGKGRDRPGLVAIRHAAIVFAPRAFLSVSKQIRPRDMVMRADFGAAKAAEILLYHVRAGAIRRIGFSVVDPLHFEPTMKIVPGVGLVGIHDRSLGNARLDP